jgi:N-acetylglucosamine malate deacetylase 1
MTVLVVAAHPDDEVLGCGASMAKWVEQGESVHVLILAEGVTARDQTRDVEKRRQDISDLRVAAQKAGEIIGLSSLSLLDFPDNRMDSVHLVDIVKPIEQAVSKLKPRTIVTHHDGDLNIDHQITHQAVAISCRPGFADFVRRILAFEVLSSTDWQLSNSSSFFRPNFFVNVEETMPKKVEALNAYRVEMRPWPHSRSLEAVGHLASLRGAAVGCQAAEGFVLLREIC